MNIEDVEKAFSEMLLIVDEGIVRVVIATAIANRMPGNDAVWLMIVGPSSCGKTEFISSLTGRLDFVYPISTLTTNTFASGLHRNDKETSLLFKVNFGIITLKDFTTIISMNREARTEIMAQLREIYDGEFIKATGTGENIEWRGRVGIIAGCTPEAYRQMTEFSSMGERFISYNLNQPNRDELARRALRNAGSIQAKRSHIKEIVAEYLTEMLDHIPTEPIDLDSILEEDLLKIASFSTLARSPVRTNYRTGVIEYVPEPEMPARMAGQFYNLARALAFMSGGELKEIDKNILYKIAIDSIPPTRRLALRVLTKYEMSGTESLATALSYPTESVRQWLIELNGLGICDRISKGAGKSDAWELKPKYRKLLSKFAKIPMLAQSLEPSKDEMENYEQGLKEAEEALDEIDWGDWTTPTKKDETV